MLYLLFIRNVFERISMYPEDGRSKDDQKLKIPQSLGYPEGEMKG